MSQFNSYLEGNYTKMQKWKCEIVFLDGSFLNIFLEAFILEDAGQKCWKELKKIRNVKVLDTKGKMIDVPYNPNHVMWHPV